MLIESPEFIHGEDVKKLCEENLDKEFPYSEFPYSMYESFCDQTGRDLLDYIENIMEAVVRALGLECCSICGVATTHDLNKLEKML